MNRIVPKTLFAQFYGPIPASVNVKEYNVPRTYVRFIAKQMQQRSQ